MYQRFITEVKSDIFLKKIAMGSFPYVTFLLTAFQVAVGRFPCVVF